VAAEVSKPLAAWSPDAVFALAGVYLMARMRT
jgi:lipopolysaccharide export LptBFGC system permease protein LptF